MSQDDYYRGRSNGGGFSSSRDYHNSDFQRGVSDVKRGAKERADKLASDGERWRQEAQERARNQAQWDAGWNATDKSTMSEGQLKRLEGGGGKQPMEFLGYVFTRSQLVVAIVLFILIVWFVLAFAK